MGPCKVGVGWHSDGTWAGGYQFGVVCVKKGQTKQIHTVSGRPGWRKTMPFVVAGPSDNSGKPGNLESVNAWTLDNLRDDEVFIWAATSGQLSSKP